MNPGWGCPHPPSTARASGGLAAGRLLGTSPCQPLLAQLLARPADSHGHLLTPTHKRWRCGPFRLPRPPGTPPPRSGAPTPVLCSPPRPRSCLRAAAHGPGLLPAKLGELRRQSTGGPWGSRSAVGWGSGGRGGPGSRQTDRQGEGPACHLAPLQRDDGGQRRARQ